MNKKLLLAGLLCCAHAFTQNMPSALSQSTLTANVLATGGGPVSISAPFPFIPSAPLNQGVIYMDSEAMLVLSANLSLNQLTVLRGYLATTAAAHNAGALAFSGQPFQFISVDKSGACDPNSPQFLNVVDQTYFSCTAGAWVGAATSNGGGGAGNPGGTNGQIQFNNAGVFGGITATGTGNVVKATSPTLVTPALGTPSALVLTNATGLPGGQITGANSVPASTLPLATTGAFGAVKPDGATITVSGGVISSTGSGSVTWPTTGDLVLSNSTSSPAGLAPINGDCVIGSGSAWVAGSCAGGSFTLPNGVLAARPTSPASPTLYLATDQPRLTELQTWDGTSWTALINIDSSGLTLNGGATLGIDQTVIPCIACANAFTANQAEALGAKWSSTHGTNATAGVATLASGTVTISTTAIAALSTGTAGDVVALTLQTCSTCGTLSVGTVTAGTSFVINSTNAGDASHVYWEIKHLN